MSLPRLANARLETALQQHEMLALTGDIWSTLRPILAGAPAICFKQNPAAYPVAYWIWQLYRQRAKLDEFGVIFSTPGFHHLPMSMLMLGMLGGVMCSCHYCVYRNFEREDGK